ncbi:Sterol uptake control protein 2 [Pseudocercospora fuligena]|uniref:Sterol uptake control protein 2 n=1 Tax=Pseudocercospora fuligena TaxID=685502 RepID=A0A8H6R626_9PEZI|nr:Sterol uptake control protein 2 [Pseudocercospora fuligena]
MSSSRMESGNARTRGTFSNSPTPSSTKGKRATHRKSRQGCVRCKKRRVKCDEAKPTCTACLTRGETCHYADVPHCHSCGCLDCDCVAAREPSAIDPVDFEFTFHYARYTYDTLVEEPSNEKIRPLLAPPASLAHSFILDLHLALAASHLACLNPTQAPAYVGHAIRYQNRALEKFKLKLHGLPKPEDCLPMFSFSAMLGLLHLAHSRVPGPDGYPVDCLLTFIELGQLWRGCRSILAMAKEVLSMEAYMQTFEDPSAVKGFLHSFPDHIRDARCQLPIDDAVIFELEHLEAVMKEECQPGRLTIFQRTLKILSHVARFHDTNRPALMLAFAVACPEEYLEMLRSGDSHARVMLGLYAALLDCLDVRWWSKGYAQDLMIEMAANPATSRHAELHQRWQDLMLRLRERKVRHTWDGSIGVCSVSEAACLQWSWQS